jgi:adenylate cyclase
VNVAARLEALAEPGGICVSGTVRDHVGDRLDLTFDDLGDQSLKNIARPVKVYRVRVADSATTAASIKPAPPVLALPDKPSIAVLPFQNMSGDPEQEYFVDGMVEEIITALSRIPWLFVIARNSSFTYKGQALDVKRVGHELGVRYVLEGSVRKSGNRVRITGQLIDTGTGAHLWADRFDGSLEDIFELQDIVASSVAGVIEPALQAIEAKRSSRRPTSDMTAYDLYLRANAMFLASSRLLPQALELVEQAIARDPSFAPALAWAAFCRGRLLVDEGSNREADRLKGIAFARRALELANDDPNTLATVAHAFGYLGEDIDAAMALVDRALTLNPSYARGWNISGALRLWAGLPKTGIGHCETALRLSPRARVGALFALIGTGHFLLSRFDDAVAKLRLDLQEDPTHQGALRVLAACYAHMGRLHEAREVVERLRQLTPIVIAGDSYLRNPEHRELYLSGLRLAAGEAA